MMMKKKNLFLNLLSLGIEAGNNVKMHNKHKTWLKHTKYNIETLKTNTNIKRATEHVNLIWVGLPEEFRPYSFLKISKTVKMPDLSQHAF